MNEPARPSEPFDFDAWGGDHKKLWPLIDELLWSEDLCERTFSSKGEAFDAGLRLASIEVERVANVDAETTARPTCFGCGRATDLTLAVSVWREGDADHLLVRAMQQANYLCSDCRPVFDPRPT